jgi:hypothetical protein
VQGKKVYVTDVKGNTATVTIPNGLVLGGIGARSLAGATGTDPLGPIRASARR